MSTAGFASLPGRTWAPDPARADADRRALLSHVRRVIAVWLVRSQRRSDADNLAVMRDFDALGLDAVHPAVFEWCYSIQDDPSPDEARIDAWAARHTEVLLEVRRSRARAEALGPSMGARIEIGAHREAQASALARARTTAEAIHSEPCRIDVVDELSPAMVRVVRAAFGELRDRWPAIHAELEAFVQRITFFESERVIGFVDMRNHGAIFLRRETMEADEHRSAEIRLAEEILHESSHVRLNAILAVDPLFLNGEEALYTSPLRREPRPMFGVFHQMYVLSRLHAFYGRLPPDSYAARRAKIVGALRDALAVVQDHARLTTAGAAMTASVELLLQGQGP